MDGRMDGWMDGWMGGWVDEWMVEAWQRAMWMEWVQVGCMYPTTQRDANTDT
jgi:beta-glucanase (GH16 family)